MKPDNKILINIIGVGYDVCVCEVPLGLFDHLGLAIATEERSLGYLLFDDEFYRKYQISKSDTKNYSCWKDFGNKGFYRGANLMERGQIEIWINRKRVKTYQFHELINNATLFPLFETTELVLSELLGNQPEFILGVQEKGHLAKYVIKSDKFLPEELQLYIVEFGFSEKRIKLLYKVAYLGVALKSLKNDTVVTGTGFNWL